MGDAFEYLWYRIQQNDNKAFDSVFKTYYPKLCNFAYRLLKNLPEAEETVQDAFINLWKNRDKIDIKNSLKSYLYQTVHNLALKKLEHFKTRKFQPNNAAMNSESWSQINNTYIIDDYFIQELESKETEALILKAIEKLPEKCREVFILSRFEDFSYEEISEKLNLSPNTVRVQIFKALKILITLINTNK